MSFLSLSERNRVSNQVSIVPSIQDFLSRVVVHHGVVIVLVCETNLRAPLCSCVGVVCKVDIGRLDSIVVDTVDNSTGNKSIPHIGHSFCEIRKIWKIRRCSEVSRKLIGISFAKLNANRKFNANTRY